MNTQLTLSEKRGKFRHLLEAQEKELSRAIPKHMNADRLIRIATTAALTQPKLLECTPASVIACLQKCSERGLEPDGYYAHLIPFKDGRSGKMFCQVIFDFKGLADLAYRSGKVVSISAQVVYEDEAADPEQFYIEYGSEERLVHKPNILAAIAGDRKPAAVYSYVKMKDGSVKFDLMPWPEVMDIARRSKTYNKAKNQWFGPWDTDTNEMAKKTVFKRLSKLLQLSPDLRAAVQADNDSEFGTDDLPDVEKMKVADAFVPDPVNEEPTTPFDQALKNEGKKETAPPEQKEAQTGQPTAQEEPPVSEEPQAVKRFRRNQKEINLANELKLSIDNPKDLREFGIDVDLDHCKMPQLQIIQKKLDDEVEAEKVESVDEVLAKEEPPKTVDAERALACKHVRERIVAYNQEGFKIDEDDIVRYAVSEIEGTPDNIKTLEDIERIGMIGFMFTDVYKWVEANPPAEF